MRTASYLVKTSVLAAVLLGLFGCGAGGGATTQVSPPPAQVSATPSRFTFQSAAVPGTTATMPWGAVTSSADGTKLAAIYLGYNSSGYAGYVYTSVDGGATWTERTSAGCRDWTGIASSQDGNNLVAVAGDGLVVSTDGGATWTQGAGREWIAVASSADSSRLAAIGSIFAMLKGVNSVIISADNPPPVIPRYLYTSSDGGSTWDLRYGAGERWWRAVASSSDGLKLALIDASSIFTSTDGGVSVTQRTGAGTGPWTAIASSSDGTRLAVAGNDWIYTSQDGGATWTQRTGAGDRAWTSIASSADGTRLAAGTASGFLYTSDDAGATWHEEAGLGQASWTSVATSADGSLLALINANSRNIRIGRSAP